MEQDMQLFVMMVIVAPLLILTGLHMMWRNEWRGDRGYTALARTIGWFYAGGTIMILGLLAR